MTGKNGGKRFFLFFFCALFSIFTHSRAAYAIDAGPLLRIWDEFSRAPAYREERCERVYEIFSRLGGDKIIVESVEDGGGDACPGNVMLTGPGKRTDLIVITAHLDSFEKGTGSLDDFSGILMMAALFEGLKQYSLNHTILFVAFDKEEVGLIGSRSFLSKRPDIYETIHASVNLECLGLTLPRAWSEGSSDALEEILISVGKTNGEDLASVSIPNVGADSLSFLDYGIPAITIIGILPEHLTFIDSARDTPDIVDREIFFRSYEILLQYILELDRLHYSVGVENER